MISFVHRINRLVSEAERLNFPVSAGRELKLRNSLNKASYTYRHNCLYRSKLHYFQLNSGEFTDKRSKTLNAFRITKLLLKSSESILICLLKLSEIMTARIKELLC